MKLHMRYNKTKINFVFIEWKLKAYRLKKTVDSLCYNFPQSHHIFLTFHLIVTFKTNRNSEMILKTLGNGYQYLIMGKIYSLNEIELAVSPALVLCKSEIEL